MAVFTDDGTNPTHYHWHNQDHGVGEGLNNGWQCHSGTSKAETTGAIVFTANHAHQGCYTYAASTQSGPEPPPGW